VTLASAKTVHQPHATTPSTSSVFIGIRPYMSTQTQFGIQSHTSSIFHKFPVWYLKCMVQASGMWLWIDDHNKCRGTVGKSTDWAGMLGILDSLELDGGPPQFLLWQLSKKAGIRSTLVGKDKLSVWVRKKSQSSTYRHQKKENLLIICQQQIMERNDHCDFSEFIASNHDAKLDL